MTARYLIAEFAEGITELLGCIAEKESYPEKEFIEECCAPPPLYFETEEVAYQGICCVCYKKGALGRCPRPECGLLMHYTCVEPT